jgi:hypothetical protein
VQVYLWHQPIASELYPPSLSRHQPLTSPLQFHLEVILELMDQHSKHVRKLLAISRSSFHI